MKKSILILLLVFAIQFAFAQKVDSLQIADGLVENENFLQAIDLYHQILKSDSLNPDINFKLGFCYLNTPQLKEKSIFYIKKAVDYYPVKKQKSFDFHEINLYLARAHRVNNQFDEAIEVLNSIKPKVTSKEFLVDIDKELKLCYTGKEMFDNQINISVKNLGSTINSSFSDHSPVFSADESVLIFTSRRNGAGKTLFPDGQYDEDLYISEKVNDEWNTPRPLDVINTTNHEASIGLSYDGQQLFIYKDEDEGSIYYSRLEGDVWSTPFKLGPNINTKYRETHATLSVDGKTLYFTSNRPGGTGGLDIYSSKMKQDGTWGEAVNLGTSINTSEDEEGPYIQTDGVTLYFSSKGHPGMGGYDIFSSKINEFGTWTKPENLGYPINTFEDDVFYAPTTDGKRAYYASHKAAGYGQTDLYLMNLNEETGTNLVVMAGKVTMCKGKLLPCDISITNNGTGDVNVAVANIKSGKFTFIANRGVSYNVMVEVNGKVVFSDDFTVPKDAPNLLIYKTIRLDPEVPCGDVVNNSNNDAIDPDNIDEDGNIYDGNIKIENILFAFGRADEPPANPVLDKLAQYLTENTTAVVELGAYADSKGSAESNQKLAVKRGDAVKKYLVKKGAKPEQLVVVGYGEENPFAMNKSKDGAWVAESQKWNRRCEFRMLVQGESTLLIRPITSIPDKYKNPKYNKKYKKSDVNNVETDF